MYKKIHNYWLNLPQKNKLISGLLLALCLSVLAGVESKTETQTPPDQVDTFIPKGFTLLPIRLQNFETVDSMVGQYAVVNLYTSAIDGKKSNGQLVAKSVRLIRSPIHPDKFAVLVPESEVRTVMRKGDNFFVAIKNPESFGMQIVNEAPLRKRRLIMEN